ncbi:HNH endonuclease family protein [Rhodococcus sp. KB6]|uniref:HNH endonuclease family protein n=1 Tax=Rhodococcus sp. KB6 TaxID=1752066 RepID=UPI0020A26335|nr:HNH endonuclease family protein [Rhodococcus sp. KB6]
MRDRATDTPCLPCLHPDAALEITRNDVLKIQLVDVAFKPGTRDCKVIAGTLHDPYTGTDIAFSTSNPSAIQIDHLLSAALSRSLPLSAGHYVDVMPLMAVVAVRWARA